MLQTIMQQHVKYYYPFFHLNSRGSFARKNRLLPDSRRSGDASFSMTYLLTDDSVKVTL